MADTKKQDKDETMKGDETKEKAPARPRSRSLSRSSTRSASYSPSPPCSPAPPTQSRRSTSQSPERSRNSQSRSRSPEGRERRESSGRSSRRKEIRSIEVSGLTKMVRESHLEHIFSPYGSITNVILPTFRMSGESRGRGYIVYRSSVSAQKAEEFMNEGQVDGVIITVRQASVPERDEEREARGHGGPARYYDHSAYPQRRRNDYEPSDSSKRYNDEQERNRGGFKRNNEGEDYRRRDSPRQSSRACASRSPERKRNDISPMR